MQRRIPIWLVALALASYGAYSARVAIAERHWVAGLFALVALLGCLGLLLDKPWSQFVVYLLAGVFIASWLYAVGYVAVAGWPYRDWSTAAFGLLPGVVLVILCVASSLVVFRHFRRSVDGRV